MTITFPRVLFDVCTVACSPVQSRCGRVCIGGCSTWCVWVVDWPVCVPGTDEVRTGVYRRLFHSVCVGC